MTAGRLLSASYRLGAVLVLCDFVAWVDRIAINLAMPMMASDLKIGPEAIGWIFGAFFFGYGVMQIPGGLLVDKVGPRRVLLTALVWWSGFTALTGAVLTLPVLVATRLLFGTGEGVFAPSVWKILGQWFTKKNRASANAIILSSVALGPALTPLLLAPLLARFGWRACFVGLSVCGLACAAIAARVVRDSIYDAKKIDRAEIAAYETDLRSRAAVAERTISASSFGRLIQKRETWMLFALCLISNVAVVGWVTWLPLYFMKARGLDLQATAIASAVPFIFAACGFLAAGYVSDRWFRGRRRLLIAACLIIGGVCLFGFVRVDAPVGYMFLQCTAGLFLFMGASAISGMTLILTPEALMGAGTGFLNTGRQLGAVLGNIAIGHVIALRGGDYAAGFDVMLVALGAAVLFVLLAIREQLPDVRA